MSATAVQEVALAAVLDGLSHPEVSQLASLGAMGLHPGNASRDLMHKVSQGNTLPEPFVIKVPSIDPLTKEYALEDCAIFLPHQVAAALQDYAEFEAIFETAKAPSFWAFVKPGDPKLHKHPMCDIEGWQDMFIPCFIHGDGVEYQNGDSLMVFHWGSLLSTQSSMQSSLLIGSWPKSCTATAKTAPEGLPGTWLVIMKVLCWSLKALFCGLHPAEDPDGNPWPDGSPEHRLAGSPLLPGRKRVCFWSILGDLDFLVNMLGLPHWSSAQWCWLDNSSSVEPHRSWKEFRPNHIGWAPRTVEDELLNRASQHPLFQFPGITCFNVALDALHILFVNGVLSHAFGSFLHSLIWPGGQAHAKGPRGRLGDIFDRIVFLYGQLQVRHRISQLQLSMICNPSAPHQSYPYLRAKGAETRGLLPVMVELAKDERYNTRDLYGQHMQACLQGYLDFDQCIEAADTIPTDEQALEAKRCMTKALIHNAWLNQWAVQNTRMLWHLVPKHHWARWMAEHTRWLNPTAVWTFKAEDYVGRIATIAHSCTFGTKRVAQSGEK